MSGLSSLDRKREIQTLERLVGRKAVMDGETLVTTYTSRPTDQKHALRRGKRAGVGEMTGHSPRSCSICFGSSTFTLLGSPTLSGVFSLTLTGVTAGVRGTVCRSRR